MIKASGSRIAIMDRLLNVESIIHGTSIVVHDESSDHMLHQASEECYLGCKNFLGEVGDNPCIVIKIWVKSFKHTNQSWRLILSPEFQVRVLREKSTPIVSL